MCNAVCTYTNKQHFGVGNRVLQSEVVSKLMCLANTGPSTCILVLEGAMRQLMQMHDFTECEIITSINP